MFSPEMSPPCQLPARYWPGMAASSPRSHEDTTSLQPQGFNDKKLLKMRDGLKQVLPAKRKIGPRELRADRRTRQADILGDLCSLVILVGPRPILRRDGS